MPIIAITLIIAAALGGGTAFAAQSALPGDALWGFKTSINEGVQSTLAGNAQVKAQLDISIAQKRLAEARQLALEGKLDAKAQAKIQANFDAHAKEAAQLIGTLRAEGRDNDAAELAATFQSTLAGEATAVAQVHSPEGGAQAALSGLSDDLRATLDVAAGLSADTTGGGSSTQVHTGTTVRGSTGGGLETTTDGTVVGI